MAKFTEEKTPYEFLVRFDENGLKGAQISFLEKILKDGEIISQKINNVHSVAIAEQQGFPLHEIIDDILKNALITLEQKEAIILEKDKEITLIKSKLISE